MTSRGKPHDLAVLLASRGDRVPIGLPENRPAEQRAPLAHRPDEQIVHALKMNVKLHDAGNQKEQMLGGIMLRHENPTAFQREHGRVGGDQPERLRRESLKKRDLDDLFDMHRARSIEERARRLQPRQRSCASHETPDSPDSNPPPGFRIVLGENLRGAECHRPRRAPDARDLRESPVA